MRKTIILLLLCLLIAAPAMADSVENALIEEKALLFQAILKLSLELNGTTEKLATMERLYTGAEEDIKLLQQEAQMLKSKLDEAMKLYADAEADVTTLREMNAQLLKELSDADTILTTYRQASSAKTVLSLLAGIVGGIAGTLLYQLLTSGN
jgi:chromosome segregation ATPase